MVGSSLAIAGTARSCRFYTDTRIGSAPLHAHPAAYRRARCRPFHRLRLDGPSPARTIPATICGVMRHPSNYGPEQGCTYERHGGRGSHMAYRVSPIGGWPWVGQPLFGVQTISFGRNSTALVCYWPACPGGTLAEFICLCHSGSRQSDCLALVGFSMGNSGPNSGPDRQIQSGNARTVPPTGKSNCVDPILRRRN